MSKKLISHSSPLSGESSALAISVPESNESHLQVPNSEDGYIMDHVFIQADPVIPTIHIHAITPLSWKSSNLLQGTGISINAGIKAWMEYDTGFSNWINTSLTNFIRLESIKPWFVPVPDQWREEMGIDEIVFEMIERAGKRVIHVLA